MSRFHISKWGGGHGFIVHKIVNNVHFCLMREDWVSASALGKGEELAMNFPTDVLPQMPEIASLRRAGVEYRVKLVVS